MKNSIYPLFFFLLLAAIISFPGCSIVTSNQAESYYNKGVAFSHQDRYADAIDQYNEAIRIDPDYTKAYNNRGNAYLIQEEFDLAIADYDKAIELDPDFALAYNNRGLAYMHQSRYDLALADFDKAIELDPSYTKAYDHRNSAAKLLASSNNNARPVESNDTNIVDKSGWPLLSDENKIIIYEDSLTGNIDDNEGVLSFHVNPTMLRACGGKPNGSSEYPYKWDSPDNLAALGIDLSEDGRIQEIGSESFPLHEGTTTFKVEVTDGLLTATGLMTLVVSRYDVSAQDGIPGVPGPWATFQQWPQDLVYRYPLPSARAGHHYGVTLPVFGGTLPYEFTPKEGFSIDTSQDSGENGLVLNSDCGIICGVIPSSLAGQTIRFSVNVKDGNDDRDTCCPEYAIKVIP